jgi:hypothetical protein
MAIHYICQAREQAGAVTLAINQMQQDRQTGGHAQLYECNSNSEDALHEMLL